MVLTHAQALYQAKDLLSAWTLRNLRARYQQSALGWLWAVFQPAAQVFIFSIIFTRFVPVNTGNIPYPIFSYIALVPWALLATSLPDMAQSLIANMNLVTKIYFPREILPIAALLARLMDFGIAASLFIVLIVIYRVPIVPNALGYLPLLLIIQLILMLGLGLASAAANVFFRDVQSVLTLGIQLWFYASPIIYPVSMVPERLQAWYFLNPMAGIIEGYRDVLLRGHVPGQYTLVSFLASLLIFIFGYWFFKRVEFQFADIV